MNETEQHLLTSEEKKEKIRQRYKGVDESQLSVIPANPKLDIFDHDKKLRVAVYARVSTDDPNQTSSYELQKNHYTDLIDHNPNWDLVDIYADEGISGTSLKHRDSFIRMIDDCKAGKIDLIITKSVSRFARNLLDGVGFVRMLGAMNPPVGVFFETENINTFNKDSEMALAFLATMAQEESHNKSEIQNSSCEMRFKRGIFLTPPLLGYDQDENGNLIINEEEAKTVRIIFFMFIFGYSCTQIADTLMKLGRKTKKGNAKWYSSGIKAQLINERHCGSVLARKTFTPNYLDHKSKKNNKDRNQYFQEEHHEPIISRQDFIYVQHVIENTKNGNISILPELKVVRDGSLSGYVFINPRWIGFKSKDYINASRSVSDFAEENNFEATVTVEQGDFDLRGFEIARSQFFNVTNRLTINLSAKKMYFSLSCIQKMACEYVEILIHPIKKTIVVQPSKTDNRLRFKWATKHGDIFTPRDINISAISPTLFELIGWDINNRYRLVGNYYTNSEGEMIIFDASESEIFIPKDSDHNNSTFNNIETFGTPKSTLAFPARWANDFGPDYYSHVYIYDSAKNMLEDPFIFTINAVEYNPNPQIKIPDARIIEEQLNSLIKEVTPEEEENECITPP